MDELSVRIERLEPMRVAEVSVVSATPEQDAINALLDWARAQGIPLEAGAFRFFGFDNCQPEPNHMYTTWLTVNPAVAASGDVRLRDAAGGAYAVTDVRGVENISPTWKRLAQWCREHGYQIRDAAALEEAVDVLTPQDDADLLLRLYLPIAG